jgi:hypothetical protein
LSELHNERVTLNKKREVNKAAIADWEEKCQKLQTLKFGQMIDLDKLEMDADHTKEDEAELSVKEVEETFAKRSARMQKEIDDLQDQLAEVSNNVCMNCNRYKIYSIEFVTQVYTKFDSLLTSLSTASHIFFISLGDTKEHSVDEYRRRFD